MNWNGLWQSVETALGIGIEPQHLSFSHLSLRTAVIFITGILMLRLGHKRFFARRNALDVLLAFIIASTLARAINGSAPFFPTIGAGFVLIFLQRALTWLASRAPWVDRLVKGSPVELINGGVVDQRALRRHDLSESDVVEDVRIGGFRSIEEVGSARLERNGQISLIERKK